MQENIFIINLVVQVISQDKQHRNVKISIPKRQPYVYHDHSNNNKIFVTALVKKSQQNNIEIEIENIYHHFQRNFDLQEFVNDYVVNSVRQGTIKQIEETLKIQIIIEYSIFSNHKTIIKEFGKLTESEDKVKYFESLQDFIRSEKQFVVNYDKILTGRLKQIQERNKKEQQELRQLEKIKVYQQEKRKVNFKFFIVKLLLLFASGFVLFHLTLVPPKKINKKQKQKKKKRGR